MTTLIRPAPFQNSDTPSFWSVFASAQGEEASLITDYVNDLYKHYTSPLSQPGSILRRFKNLSRTWQEETMLSSSLQEVALHPAYQEIIGMGEKAIPLILEELKYKPGHWFWALRSITGENPVPPENQGNFPAMTENWVEWGVKNGYL